MNRKKLWIKSLLSFLLCFCLTSTFAQKTKIIGKVIDAKTLEAIPFVNLILEGTTIGTTTDFDGNFVIETTEKADTLKASCVGYFPLSRSIKANRFQEIKLLMQPSQVTLDEVVILPGENPAEVLLKKIIANKKKNTNREVDYYEYEEYNKIEFDANNISEKFKKKKLLKPFEFIWQYMDTSTVNGKSYLPVFLNESITKVYIRNNPKKKIEEVEANKISGFENQSITELLDFLYQNTNVYSNYINLFDKNFLSPIANSGLLSYKYYLVDSAYKDKHWCYQIMFKPRRKQELTFTGNFWVADTSYAIKSVEMKVAGDANLNFVDDVAMKQEFVFVDDKYWMLSRDYLIADFNVIEDTKNVLGFYGHRTTTYDKYSFNKERPDDFYRRPVNKIELKDAFDKGDDYWKEARHESLTEKEEGIYVMVDSIKNVPIFNTYLDVLYLITNGYYKAGKIELGPYHKAFSFNPVEEYRFRFGGRTTKELSDKYRLAAYLAYGTKDRTFKYEVSGLFILNKTPRRTVFLKHRYDLDQLGASFNAFSEDNLIGAIFRRSPSDQLIFVNQYSGYYEHEWFTGFSNKFRLKWENLQPKGGTIVKVRNNDGSTRMLNTMTTAEVGLELRFALNERYVTTDFERGSLGTKSPVITLAYNYTVPNIADSDFEAHKLQLGVGQWFNVFNFGWSKYSIQSGQVFGTLPYPLLNLPPGNQSFIFDEFSFNLMNYFEFVTDRYVSFSYTHHFDGFFLNRIPLMRKLKWREVAHFKGIWGDLNAENTAYNVLPSTTTTLEKPYFEAGVGIENIFKVLRVDAVWRLSHLNTENANNFAVFGSLFFSF